jgi:hypothetical protein
MAFDSASSRPSSSWSTGTSPLGLSSMKAGVRLSPRRMSTSTSRSGTLRCAASRRTLYAFVEVWSE